LQEQIKGNPFLQHHNVQDFIQYRMHTPTRKTPYEAEQHVACDHDH